MEYLRNGDVIDMGIFFLDVMGENSINVPLKVVAFRIINCTNLFIIGGSIATNLWYAKGEEFVDTLEDMCSVLQTVFKYVLIIYYKDKIKEILDTRARKYCNYQSCPDKKLVTEIESAYKTTKVVAIMLIQTLVSALLLILLKPLFNTSGIFLAKCKVLMDSLVVEILILVVNYYFFGSVLLIILICDIMYLVFCIDLTMQVKLLKFDIKTTNSKSTNLRRNIAKCVKHHLLLLQVYEQIQEIFSMALLFHYFVSMLTAFCDMYQTLVEETNLWNELLKFLSLAAIVSQFAFYAIPAEILTSEFISIAHAVYMSDWYKNDASIQKLMLPIMVRAQRTKYFSGAGFLDINVQAFASVINKTVSFYAIARNLLGT